MRLVIVLVMLLVLSATQADAACRCASSAWIAGHGGLADSRWQESAGRAANILRRRDVGQFRVYVLNEAYPAAYAWPDGDVYVTRGLVEGRSDEHVAAAVAHELGHLMNDGHLALPQALSGAKGGTPSDIEENADATGAHLLKAAGRDPGAMRRLLKALSEDMRLEASVRDHFKMRATKLESQR